MTIRIPIGNNLSYIAGIFDGEGHFHLTRTGWVIGFTNTNRRVMNYLRGQLGRNYYAQKNTKPNCQKSYKLWVCGRIDVLKLTEAMLPFLIIKRRKALQVATSLTREFKTKNGSTPK